jgi:hypothetical protein
MQFLSEKGFIMRTNGIANKILKSIIFIFGGALSLVGIAAIMASCIRPEILNPDFIIGMTYRTIPAFTVFFLGAVLAKIDVGIWH